MEIGRAQQHHQRRFWGSGSCSCCLAVIIALVYFIWLLINVLVLSMSTTATATQDQDQFIPTNVLMGLQRVYQSMGFFVVHVDDSSVENNIRSPAVAVTSCIMQFILALYLLWGVISESTTKLKVWLLYNVMAIGISFLFFVQLFFIGGSETLCPKSLALYRIQLFRDTVSFCCFNGFYIYQISSFRRRVLTRKVQIGRTAVITRTRSEPGNDRPGPVRPGSRNNFNRICTDIAVGLHVIIHGAKVIIIIIFLFRVSTAIDKAAKRLVINCSVDATMSFLGVCIAYILWKGNHSGNNKHILFWMAFQIVSCVIEYLWLLFTAAVGFSFDMIILRFLSTFPLVVVTVSIVSKRITEIGASSEFQGGHDRNDPLECGRDAMELLDIPVHM